MGDHDDRAGRRALGQLSEGRLGAAHQLGGGLDTWGGARTTVGGGHLSCHRTVELAIGTIDEAAIEFDVEPSRRGDGARGLLGAPQRAGDDPGRRQLHQQVGEIA
ncbi:hypothetical protein SDC9_184510 [bioreactor metagenome]|uniref:Uncharacterized protein n=1 Tax=bioreactor metagenome TaxID=1076179 RepID=A0A645HD86_9ZZZZ